MRKLNTIEFSECISNTGVTFGEIPDFQHCTGRFSGSEISHPLEQSNKNPEPFETLRQEQHHGLSEHKSEIIRGGQTMLRQHT